MRYEKPARVFESQLDLLVGRGLTVANRLVAIRWLKNVSYYRLSAYMLPFKAAGVEAFIPGTTFEQITDLYRFDRRLRLILLEAIERIEIALRAAVTYELAICKGPFAHTERRNFDCRFDHQKMLDEIATMERDSNETFVVHYRDKYFSEPHLPIWMATELLSFGYLSRMYAAVEPAIKNKFARGFDVDKMYVQNWTHVLNYVLNVCAHHCRLWNRELAIKPRLPAVARNWPYGEVPNDRLYSVLVIVRHSLSRLFPNTGWHRRLFALFDEFPQVPRERMGIPENWREIAPWV
jgi:abortive infection bacteriophage resistance protein